MWRHAYAIDHDNPIVLIDFGFTRSSSQSDDEELLSLNNRADTRVGSPSYAAPEMILEKQYSKKSDAFSLGIILFILLQGYMPFPEFADLHPGARTRETYHLKLDPLDWATLSTHSKDLVVSLCESDPEKRLSVKDALDHPWFHQDD